MNVKKSFAVASLFAVAAFSANSALACNALEDVLGQCGGGGAIANLANQVFGPGVRPVTGALDQLNGRLGNPVDNAIRGAVITTFPATAPWIAGAEMARNFPQPTGYPQGGGYPQPAGYPQGGGYPQPAGYPQGAGYPQLAGYSQGGYPQVGYRCITEAAIFVGGPAQPIGTACLGQLPNGMLVNGRIG